MVSGHIMQMAGHELETDKLQLLRHPETSNNPNFSQSSNFAFWFFFKSGKFFRFGIHTGFRVPPLFFFFFFTVLKIAFWFPGCHHWTWYSEQFFLFGTDKGNKEFRCFLEILCIIVMFIYCYCSVHSAFIVPTGTPRLPCLRFFRAFSSAVRQRPGCNPQRRCAAGTVRN